MSKSTTAAKTVIVGGGVVGLTLACELARRGERSITLIERGDPGAGATFQSGGGIRRVFGNQLDVQMMQLSVEILERFARDFGVDPRFQRIGYLYLLQTDAEIAAAEQALEVVQAEGVEVDLLSAADVRERFPWIAPHGIRHALWSPQDGY